ncbi:MAG: heavy-metal-associated domain-containing protein [Bacteroidales bacterium]|nr:heavy-metal-associated domain-containing protein [Bacteroidales bacterium]
MKRKIFITLTMVLAFGMGLMAQNLKTEKVKVYGQCGMCEKRIDNAAKSVDGVTKANWDKETSMLEVTYDPAKTNLEKIETAVTKVGHDTDAMKADDKTYSSLPGCCKYERPKK